MIAASVGAMGVLVAFAVIGPVAAVVLQRQLHHTRRELEIEQYYARAERDAHIAAEAKSRAQVQAAMARDEAGRLAIDAAEAMTHDIARLVDALGDAIALIGGKPQDWRRLCPKYRIDDRLFTPGALKDAAVGEWQRLLDEVQATPASGTGSGTSTAAPISAGHLQLVRNHNPAARPAVRPLSPADALDTIGPGIGA